MERRFITNIHEVERPDLIAGQVSHMINAYNANHPFEMLPKNTEIIVSQLAGGLSLIITTLEGNPVPKVLFHGSLYPNFEPLEENILGCQVVECGSWMVHPDHRSQGIGTLGAQELVNMGRQKWSPVLFLATHIKKYESIA